MGRAPPFPHIPGSVGSTDGGDECQGGCTFCDRGQIDFDDDGNEYADDATMILWDFGKNEFNNPCTDNRPCYDDVDCNGSCDANDANTFLEDFGLSQFNNPCPTCVAGAWCVY